MFGFLHSQIRLLVHRALELALAEILVLLAEAHRATPGGLLGDVLCLLKDDQEQKAQEPEVLEVNHMPETWYENNEHRTRMYKAHPASLVSQSTLEGHDGP